MLRTYNVGKKIKTTIKLFFEKLQLIYSIFKKPKIKQAYKGTSLKRLLDTRCHFQATKTIFENFHEIVAALEEIKCNRSIKMDGEDIVF